MEIKVSQISEWVNGKIIKGDKNTVIKGINSIDHAQHGDLIFVRDEKYESLLAKTKASAVLIGSEPHVSLPDSLVCILVQNPELAFIQIMEHFYVPKTQIPEGIHPTAVVEETVVLGKSVAIGPFVYIGNNSAIGDGVKIFPHVYIGEECEIGKNTVIFPNVTIREATKIGSNCIIHSGVCVGTDGFGFIYDGIQWHKVPQIGCVIIEDNVEIGSNTCIDRATLGETRIGEGTKIDNLVQIGHNVKIGKNCAIAATTGIAGSATIGNGVRIGAGAGINGHITIGDNATIGAWSGVAKSIDTGAIVSGFPATEHSRAKRILVAQQHVPELIRRVRELEIKIQEIESKSYEKSTNNR